MTGREQTGEKHRGRPVINRTVFSGGSVQGRVGRSTCRLRPTRVLPGSRRGPSAARGWSRQQTPRAYQSTVSVSAAGRWADVGQCGPRRGAGTSGRPPSLPLRSLDTQQPHVPGLDECEVHSVNPTSFSPLHRPARLRAACALPPTSRSMSPLPSPWSANP